MKTVYADANATYPSPEGHLEQLFRRLEKEDGNPSSGHRVGRAARYLLEEARGHLSDHLQMKDGEWIFTSGATESNNMVLQGVAHQESHASSKPHVVITPVEHRSVLECAELLRDRGWIDLSFLEVDQRGVVTEESLHKMLRKDTRLVCLVYGNNEMGVVQPLDSLMPLIRSLAPMAHVHLDAVQMLGKFSGGLYKKYGVDSASFSAHKIGALKGIGGLYLKSGTRLERLSAGGAQERGRRPGTENTAGILSFGMRIREVHATWEKDVRQMALVRDDLLSKLKETIPGFVQHGAGADLLPNTLHFHVEEVPGDTILMNFDLEGICASSGSACSTGSARPSHVLTAMGYSPWVGLNSIRMSFTHQATLEDSAYVAKVLAGICERVKRRPSKTSNAFEGRDAGA